MQCKIKSENRIDNCGPDTKGDYCLFHKPHKDKEESLAFYNTLLERYDITLESESKIQKKIVVGSELNWSYFRFPAIQPQNDFSFRNIDFKKPLLLNNSVFEERVDFVNTIFKDRVELRHVVFKSWTYFHNVTFREATSFAGAVFENTIVFRDTVFELNTRTGFDFVEFKDNAYFEDTEFHSEVFFPKVIFHHLARFESCKFKGFTDFTDSKFNEDAVFLGDEKDENQELVFRKETTFENCIFLGTVRFTAIFDSIANFSKCHFHGDLIFHNSIFKDLLKFSSAEIIGNAQIAEREFNNTFLLPSAEAEACRLERLYYEREGEKDKADNIFVIEMRARKWISIKSKKSKSSKVSAYIFAGFEWTIADLPIAYGTDWKRLFFSLGTLIGFFTGCYWVAGLLTNPRIGWIVSNPDKINCIITDVWGSLYYSIITFTTLGYGDLYPIGVMRYIAALESFIGAVFMALIVAVFARKWMR